MHSGRARMCLARHEAGLLITGSGVRVPPREFVPSTSIAARCVPPRLGALSRVAECHCSSHCSSCRRTCLLKASSYVTSLLRGGRCAHALATLRAPTSDVPPLGRAGKAHPHGGASKQCRLEPAATESRPQQSGNDDRATAHDAPQQARPIVLDHQHDRTLIDAKVIRRDPPTGRSFRRRKRLVEGWLEPVFSRHSQVQSRKVTHCGDDDLRRKR
jgi:hypothetical protein